MSMNAETINAFLKAAKTVFKTATQTEIAVDSPVLKQDLSTTYDVSGVIGISGAVKGVIVLSFPQDVAETFFARFTGMPFSDEVALADFADAIGELANMVAGNAKARLNHADCSISCPSVVLGKGISVLRPRNVPSLCLPCNSDAGSFVIELTLEC